MEEREADFPTWWGRQIQAEKAVKEKGQSLLKEEETFGWLRVAVKEGRS